MCNKFKQIRVITDAGVVEFTGRHRRMLEKPNWHYYEDSAGNIHHFRKEHMIAVVEGNNARIDTR